MEKAVKYLGEYLLINPDSTYALNYKGLALLELAKLNEDREKHLEEALDAFNSCLRTDAKYTDVAYNKALTLFEMGKYEKAGETFSEFGKKKFSELEKVKKIKKDTEEFEKVSETFEEARKAFEKAADAYAAILNNDPEAHEAAYLKVISCFELQKLNIFEIKKLKTYEESEKEIGKIKAKLLKFIVHLEEIPEEYHEYHRVLYQKGLIFYELGELSLYEFEHLAKERKNKFKKETVNLTESHEHFTKAILAFDCAAKAFEEAGSIFSDLIERRPKKPEGRTRIDPFPLTDLRAKKVYSYLLTYPEKASEECFIFFHEESYSQSAKYFGRFSEKCSKYLDLWDLKQKVLYTMDREEEVPETQKTIKQIESVHVDSCKYKGLAYLYLNKYFEKKERYEIALQAFKDAKEIRDDDEEAWYYEGLVFSRLKNHNEALKSYEKALKRKPQYKNALLGRAFSYCRLEKYKEAIQDCDKVLEEDHGNEEAWIGKGFTYVSEGKVDEALKAFEKALELNPEDSAALFGKGCTLCHNDNFEYALDVFEEALDLNPKDYKALIGKGFTIFMLRIAGGKGCTLCYSDKFKEALDVFEEALDLNPKDYKTLIGKGFTIFLLRIAGFLLRIAGFLLRIAGKEPEEAVRVHMQNEFKEDQFEEGMKAFEKALEINRYSESTWFGKGFGLFQCKRYEEAIKAFDKALQLNPKYEVALYNRGFALLLIDDYQGALKSFNKTLEINPTSGIALIGKGFTNIMLEEYEKALSAFDEAENSMKAAKESKKRSDIRLAQIGKGFAYNRLREPKLSLKAFNEALKDDQENDIALTGKGFSLIWSGKYREAVETFDEALRILDKKGRAKDSEVAFFGKGFALNRANKYEKALEAYKKALEINPENTSAHNYVARFFLKLGVTDEARNEARKVLNIDPKNPTALMLCGQVKVEMKIYDEAINYFNRAISGMPGDYDPLLWKAYATYLRAEYQLGVKHDEYNQELLSVIRELEKVNDFLKKGKMKNNSQVASNGKKANEWKYEQVQVEEDTKVRACVLYFLGCFYCKTEDFLTAKERLRECVRLKAGSPVTTSANDLLEYIWKYQIKPPIWKWWWKSPFLLSDTLRKKIGFVVIAFFIFLLLVVHPLVASFTPRTLGAGVEWSFYTLLIIFLFFILVSPIVENFKGENIEIKMQAPPMLTVDMTPSMFETIIRSYGKSPAALKMVMGRIAPPNMISQMITPKITLKLKEKTQAAKGGRK